MKTLSCRAIALSVALFGSVILIVALGWWRQTNSAAHEASLVVPSHRSSERADILRRLSVAIVPTQRAQTIKGACPELANVKNALDTKLAALGQARDDHPAVIRSRYALDILRLAENDELTDSRRCRHLAEAVDEEVKRSWRLFMVADTWKENAYNRESAAWGDRSWIPRLSDIDTPDAWALQKGCISDAQSKPLSGVCNGKPVNRLDTLIADPQLREALDVRLAQIARSPSGHTTMAYGKEFPVGRGAKITLDQKLQNHADQLARCFTGDTTSCRDVLPKHLQSDWHFQEGAIRAGATAVTVVKVVTGEVVAASGSISDCTRKNLDRTAASVMKPGGVSRWPLFRDGSDELCAQVPDRSGRAGYLTHSPLFWLVGPGSTNKPAAFLASLDAGHISTVQDAYFRTILAKSHDPDGGQMVPQRLARQAAPNYRHLMDYLGFTGTGRSVDVLTGTPGNPGTPGTWSQTLRAGFVDEKFAVDDRTFQRVYEAKRSGRNADALFGSSTVSEYLKAYRLGISAIGSGDIRHTVWGLADWTRRLALRAEGDRTMPATHMVVLEGSEVVEVDLSFSRPESVQRLLGMLGAATSAKEGGTAAGSCRTAFGACPLDGHPNIVFAKTGTAETGPGGEASPWIKSGGAGTPPAKLFMMAFRGADGELYAAAAMTLRIRARIGSSQPELQSNSAAELAMLLARPLIEQRARN